MSIQAVPEVYILFWHHLVFASSFEVPGSPSHDTRVYHESEYGHMSLFLVLLMSTPRRHLIVIWPSFMTMTWLESMDSVMIPLVEIYTAHRLYQFFFAYSH